MRKLILAVITLCMIFSFTACGNDADKPITEQDLENWTEKDLEDALLALESAEEAANAANQETAAPAGVTFEAKQEIIDAAWDSGLIQIDDKLIQLPIYLSELPDLGLDYELDHGKKSKDFLFTKNENFTLNLMYNGQELASIIFSKQTENPETVEEMNPLIEEIDFRTKPENVSLYFPGGLTFGDPYTSIEEKLGKASEISSNLTYTYGQTGGGQGELHYGISIYVNRDTQSLSVFRIGKSIQESSRENFTTITFEDVPNVQTSDVHNVTLLWAPEYKQVPGFLVMDRCLDSVLNDNGKKFYLSISFNMLAMKYDNPYDYISYGDPVLDTTDENGMNRRVYNTGTSYVVVCSTDVHLFKARIEIKDMTDPSEDALAAVQDLVLEIANSVQY